ncbi:MAG: VOC family protein [Gammaproteobacteria bacterium]|nr:VOC family protein [Gammaproteobacteria bacterium]
MELDFVVDQGTCHIFRLTELSYLGICCLPDRPSEKSAVTITIVSDDVDEWYRFLTAKGVKFIKKPSHSLKFNVYSSLFMSPHGYRIEVQSFANHDWYNRSV